VLDGASREEAAKIGGMDRQTLRDWVIRFNEQGPGRSHQYPEVRAALAPGTPVEVWFQDEMRVGQKNKLTYRWAR
jgi:transposase